MKKRNPQESFTYDEKANEQTANQIMEAYASGVVDHPDGQFHIYDQEDNS
jgi:hypothetical protein